MLALFIGGYSCQYVTVGFICKPLAKNGKKNAQQSKFWKIKLDFERNDNETPQQPIDAWHHFQGIHFKCPERDFCVCSFTHRSCVISLHKFLTHSVSNRLGTFFKSSICIAPILYMFHFPSRRKNRLIFVADLAVNATRATCGNGALYAQSLCSSCDKRNSITPFV